MMNFIPNLSDRRFTGRHPERAMTLLEILVAVGVMVVILGIAYGMVIESERSSKKIDQREMSIVYCQRVIEQVSAALRAAVPPSELAGGGEAFAPLFEASHLAVMVLDHETTGGLARVSFSLDPEGRDGAGTILRRIGPAAGGPESVSEDDLYITLPPSSRVSLEFGYAGPQQPGSLASYQPAWPAGQWPSLVRIRVSVAPEDASLKAIEMETAVIPSMIPSPGRPAPLPQAQPDEPQGPLDDTGMTTATVILDTESTSSREVTQ